MAPIRQLIEQATPKSDAAKAQLEAIRSLIELNERLSPAVMLAVVEALEGIESVVSREANAANSISGEMGARLSDVRRALSLLNGTPSPAPQPEKE